MLINDTFDDSVPIPVSTEAMLSDEVLGEPLKRIKLELSVLSMSDDIFWVVSLC